MRQNWWLPCIGMASAMGLSPGNLHAGAAPTWDRPALSINVQPGTHPAAPKLQQDELTTPPIRAAGDTESPARQLRSPASKEQAAQIARLRARALSAPAAPGRASPQQANAAWLLGLLYLHGIGVENSRTEAASWFSRAQVQGEPLAAAGLAWCAIDGCTGAPDPEVARRWLSRLGTVNSPRAMYLQWLLEARLAPLQPASPGDQPGTRPPEGSGRQLLARAAAAGDVQARLELGLLLAGADRSSEALEQFRAAAARSPAAASNVEKMMVRMRKTGDVRQAQTAQSSAEKTLAEARRNHRGDGQIANYAEAIRLYRLAQSKGSEEARKMLELIFSRPAPDGSIDIQWMQQLANVDVSGAVPTIDNPVRREQLSREPTPLSDFLPPLWRKALRENQLAS